MESTFRSGIKEEETMNKIINFFKETFNWILTIIITIIILGIVILIPVIYIMLTIIGAMIVIAMFVYFVIIKGEQL